MVTMGAQGCRNKGYKTIKSQSFPLPTEPKTTTIIQVFKDMICCCSPRDITLYFSSIYQTHIDQCKPCRSCCTIFKLANTPRRILPLTYVILITTPRLSCGYDHLLLLKRRKDHTWFSWPMSRTSIPSQRIAVYHPFQAP
ncbi:hypothetical protein K492DRAFT_10401 [Lichtheimia hyalospora FSU 10163]|nr:hypothetical protein K492DRAFT_10401 [Lichtheimia hyalospora FSU 10163]